MADVPAASSGGGSSGTSAAAPAAGASANPASGSAPNPSAASAPAQPSGKALAAPATTDSTAPAAVKPDSRSLGEKAFGVEEDDAAPPAAKPEEADPKPEVKKDDFDADLLAAAKEYDISEADARDMGPKALKAMIRAEDQRAAKHAKAQREDEKAKAEAKEKEGKEPVADAKIPAEDSDPDVDAVFKDLEDRMEAETVSELRKVHDTAVKTAVRQVREEAMKEISALRQELEDRTGFIQQERADRQKQKRETYRNDFDTAHKALGPEYKDLLGEKPWREQDPTSASVKNLEAVQEMMNDLQRFRVERKQAPLPVSALFKRAVETVFSERTQELARKQIVATREQRNKSAGFGEDTSLQNTDVNDADEERVRKAGAILERMGIKGDE